MAPPRIQGRRPERPGNAAATSSGATKIPDPRMMPTWMATASHNVRRRASPSFGPLKRMRSVQVGVLREAAAEVLEKLVGVLLVDLAPTHPLPQAVGDAGDELGLLVAEGGERLPGRLPSPDAVEDGLAARVEDDLRLVHAPEQVVH